LATLITLRLIIGGLQHPVQVVSAHDGTNHLFAGEQAGRVWLIDNDGAHLFLDASSLIDCCDNGGLLSLVLHPRYAENGRLFLMYVNHDGDTTVAEFRQAALVRTIVVIDQPAADRPNHHGGTLQFGDDGFLYISVGDGGVMNGVTHRAQNLGTFLGKLLRVDVDRDAPPEIWALGLRNPWRFSFDRAGGQLIIGDVGQDSWEELDVIDIATIRGANFGWPMMEGTHCYPAGTVCNSNGLTLPVLEYGHDAGCSITAGYRYRGKRIPALAGHIVYGDFCSGAIWTDNLIELARIKGSVVSFGEDDDGELYVVDYLGSIFRIEPRIEHRRAATH
jgi:glucose/arabinose dehydrogenase